jgi:hypothetical protein
MARALFHAFAVGCFAPTCAAARSTNSSATDSSRSEPCTRSSNAAICFRTRPLRRAQGLHLERRVLLNRIEVVIQRAFVMLGRIQLASELQRGTDSIRSFESFKSGSGSDMARSSR